MKKVLTALTALLATTLAANAVPAKRGLFEYTQPDGTVITARLVGDEFAHYYVTEGGSPMLRAQDGYLRLVSADASGKLVFGSVPTAVEMRKAPAQQNLDATYKALQAFAAEAREASYPQSGKGLFTSNYPRTGDVRCLVFIVEYSDVKFTLDNPKEYFTNMLNEEGFSEYGGTGSARDYFLYQSNNKFRPEFDVYGPVTLPNTRAYYGANNWGGNDGRPQKMVTDAAEILKDEIDFSKYDFDNDGQVDNIYVFYAGQGEASGGPSDSVWPHSWSIENGPTYDGKTIYSYTCSNEWEGTASSGHPDGIGTFCHEFSHTMGLPDLYCTDYGSARYSTPSEWSVLDYGPYNNDGRTPPNYSAFERNAMGWLNGIVVDGPDSIELDAIDKCNEAVVIATEKENEFFLFENRQQEGWDEFIPGHGMLIWHVDFVQGVWDGNRVNNDVSHQYVDLVEANNQANSNFWSTMEGYSFPGTSGNTSFTATSTPAFVSWGKKAVNLPITDIAERDGKISFDVAGGALDLTVPTGLKATANDLGEILVEWEAVAGAQKYNISVYSRGENGEPQYFGDYKEKTLSRTSSHTVQGVPGPMTYYVRINAWNTKQSTEYTEEVSVDVPEVGFRHLVPTALEADECTPDSFRANWLELPRAAKYYLTVEGSMVFGSHPDEIVDFGSGSALSLPEGWVWSGSKTSLYFPSSSGYFGESAPSLKFQKDGEVLTSPLYDTPLSRVIFWVRGAGASDDCRFDVYARGDEGDEWVSLCAVAPLSDYNTASGYRPVLELDGISYRQLRFVYTKGTRGNAALDDISIRFAQETFVALDGYNGLDMGSETAAVVENLPDGICNYRYYVVAEDADGTRSATSNKINVLLEPSSAISDPAAGTVLTIVGNTVTYTGAEGDIVNMFDLAGRKVASAVTAADGSAAIKLPSGFYLISTPASTTKAIVK